MLVTSSQVSLAISSIIGNYQHLNISQLTNWWIPHIVFIFTTALFLCGYAIQQKTVNDIREAIKPAPRPIHTNLYVPPKPGDNPADDGETAHMIEIITDEQPRSDERQESEEKSPETQTQTVDYTEAGDQLVQGSDGGLIRVSRQGRRKMQKQKAILDDGLSSDLESYISRISEPRKSPEAHSRDSREMLSRAARRKILKEELAKLAGDEKLLNNPNVYRRRRLW